MAQDAVEGQLLWQPSAEAIAGTNLTRFMTAAGEASGRSFADYRELHAWSVEQPSEFWKLVWQHFDVLSDAVPEAALPNVTMPFADWFPGARLNYAEHCLRRRDNHLAVIHRAEDGARTTLSYAELADRVARARAGLQRLGVVAGDRVAGYVPNAPEALIAFLATASLGAIWSSASPEFGVASVLDRFRQIEPKVLIAVDGYRYGGKDYDRRDAVAEIRAGLESLAHTVIIPAVDGELSATPGVCSFESLLSTPGELEFERVPFGHPLYILYSSGTTGLPKPIVHGHGGILLEHYKTLSLHSDLGEADRFFWFTTTGRKMWNYLVSGLLLGSTIVLFDGNPGYPDLTTTWKLAADEQVTYFGTSAPFIIACKKAELTPGKTFDLSRVRGVGSTGAPLPADGFGWVYEAVGKDLLLGSVSGGTDVCTAFVLSCPNHPVHAGEIQVAGLGCDVKAFSDEGEPVIGELGELVLTTPMPSMPVKFWNDPDGVRYRASYFEKYPGVWCHGDFVKFTERGSLVIYGRSDSTLNRGGVRMGTSEFYRVVDGFAEVQDTLVVDTGSITEEGRLWLFIVLAEGQHLTDELQKRIKSALRSELSPRHGPDEIRAIAAVPRTISGKKLEVPIKRILNGVPRDKALTEGALKNPEAVDDVLHAMGRG